MTKVEKLEKDVTSLSEKEYNQFRYWFLEQDWEKWDNQIEVDSKKGKLDFLITEAIQNKKQNELKDL